MKKISENISYKEAVRSETAKRLGISNKPKKEHIENMELIAEKIFGAKIQFIPFIRPNLEFWFR